MAGLRSYKISARVWIEKTNAIGIKELPAVIKEQANLVQLSTLVNSLNRNHQTVISDNHHP